MEMGQPEKGSESDREKNIKMVKRQLITAGNVIIFASRILMFFFLWQRCNRPPAAWCTSFESSQTTNIRARPALLS